MLCPNTRQSLDCGHSIALPKLNPLTILNPQDCCKTADRTGQDLQAYSGDGGAGLLSLREDKALHEPVVTSVDRRHPLLLQFRPWPLAAAAGASQPADAPANSASTIEPGTIAAGACIT